MTPEQRDAAIARNRAYAVHESRNRIIPPDPDWPLPRAINVRRCTTYDLATGECRCPRD